MLKPILRWPGGKRWLAPAIAKIYSAGGYAREQRRVVEPFAGGLAVTLRICPRQALVNDANAHVVNFYRWVKNGLTIHQPLVDSREDFSAKLRELNALISSGKGYTKEAAILFYYVNRLSANGVMKLLSSGRVYASYSNNGKYRKYGVKATFITDFREYSQAMAEWEITCGDFESVRLAPGDFLYVDPPYDGAVVAYTRSPFGWADQVRLAEWIASHDGPVIVSNAATARVVALYRAHGIQMATLVGPRSIAFGRHRPPAIEIIGWRGIPTDLVVASLDATVGHRMRRETLYDDD